MAVQGFDNDYYLKAKLAALQADPKTSSDWVGKDVDDLADTLTAAGFASYDPATGKTDFAMHYSIYGYKEGLGPNAYFNEAEYKLAKATQMYLNGGGKYISVEQAMADFDAKWTGNAYEHYVQFGYKENLNPSSNFDEALYLNEKLNQLKADDPAWAGKTIADLKVAFGEMTALSHFIWYGQAEGLLPIPAHIGITMNIDSVEAAGSDVMQLTGDQTVRIDFTNPANQIKGLDLNGDGVIAANGIENNITGKASGFEIVDAYARNPLNESDKTANYLGDINFDGTGFNGDGVNTDGNIYLGGLGVDTAFGGIGNDFMVGGGVATGRFVWEPNSLGVLTLMDKLYNKPAVGAIADSLSGGRNADFFFAELSALDPTDGLGTTFNGGSTTDNSAAGLAEALSGWVSQNNDWMLLEASDDDEPVLVNLSSVAADVDGDGVNEAAGSITTNSGRTAQTINLESFDASGNLYGFINDVDVEIGGRATDLRSTDAVVGTENFGIGSTAQLNVLGNAAANVIIGGYDNDRLNGAAGSDIIFGGNLKFLLTYQNNPNLIDANGGLDLNANAVGTVNDGVDTLLGGAGNDHIVFEMDGGIITGGGNTGTTSFDTLKTKGDTLWMTDFTMGRIQGATLADEATAQEDTLALLTSDSIVRIDLGNDGAVNFRNYGGTTTEADGTLRLSQDTTNYKTGVSDVTMTGMTSVITTGLGEIDFKAAGSNSPELNFNNQQNFFDIDADLDLRGNAQDNTLYANTGADVLEGRTGDDNLSGGTNDDTFIFQFGDNVDIVHRQIDANGDNLWDNYNPLTGKGDYGQDFRAPQIGDISSSRLVVDFGATDLTSTEVTVAMFNLNIGGVEFNVNTSYLALANSITEIAAVVNSAYQAIDTNVTAIAVGNTIVVTDASGHDISDTIPEGYAVGVILGSGSAVVTPTFYPGGTPIDIVENDIIIFKNYDNRAINLGTNETITEINNAADLVAKFDTSGTQLAQGQSHLIRLTDISEGDIVTVTINGKNYSYTATAGENAETVSANLVALINNELDLNSGSGEILATDSAESNPDFDDVGGPGSLNTAVFSVDQTNVVGSQTYMNVSVSVTNALTGSPAGIAEIHNQSNTHIDLVGFDGRNGNLNADDVLFLGRGADSVSILQTALTAGETLTGQDATLDADSTPVPGPTYYDWINGDDLLYGGDGNDTINAGTGDDRIMVSKGTDTVAGGGNVINPDGATHVFQDVLQAEEMVFGTGTRFKVTLDGTLGVNGSGTVAALDSSNANLGTTTFTQIENVRVLENSRASTLDIQTLSNNVAAAIATGLAVDSGIGEGVVVNMTRLAPDVNYTIDVNNDGKITPSATDHDPITGDYDGFTTTAVYGAENLVAGNANETINIDESQITANNRIEAGSEQDNNTTLVEGEDVVVYDHNNAILDNAQATATTFDDVPAITVKAEASSNTDEVSMTGGVLRSNVFTDTLIDVERVDVTLAAQDGMADGLDVSAIDGATIAFGTAVLVSKSLGGASTLPDTIAEVEADTLENGGISVSGDGLGNEVLEITGITQLETITGSAGDDRVIVGDALLMNNMADATNVALGRATILGTAAALVVRNAGLYEFNLGAGTDDSVDYFNAADDIVVSVDTTGDGEHYVLVDETAGGGLVLNDNIDDRVDFVTGVEQFWASDDTNAGINGIDLTAATVATTIEFSKYSDLNSNEMADPNGDNDDAAVDIVRGIEVSSTATNAELAMFMERTTNFATGDANPNGQAHWNTIYGSATLAETVIFTDNEVNSGIAHTMILGAGANEVDYSDLTTGINAAVQSVDTKNNTQDVKIGADTVTVAYADYDVDTPLNSEDTLTIIGSGDNSDTIDISALTVSTDSYNLVDLVSGIVVEDVLNTVAADEQAKVIYIEAFENITGSADIDRLYGNGSINSIDGAASDDWIVGRGGRGALGAGPDGDLLTGGAGNDRFIYETESDSATNLGIGGFTDESQDTIVDFAVTDMVVFNTTDSGAVKAGALATTVGDLGAGKAFSVVIDQNGDGAITAVDDDYSIIDTTGNMDDNLVILRVSQSAGQDIQHLDAVIGAVDGQYEIVYTAASQSNNLALPDEFHMLELDTAGAGIGNSADKFDFRTFDFGVFSGDQAAGGPTAPDDLNNDGISDLVQDIIYSSPVTVNSLVSVDNFFFEGAVATGAHRAVHVQLEAGSDSGGADGYDFRVFVDLNRDGNYTQADDLVFDLVDVLDVGLPFTGALPVKADFFSDALANGAGSGIFIFNDAQYGLWA